MTIDLLIPPLDDAALDQLEVAISLSLAADQQSNPMIVAIDRPEPGVVPDAQRRWYVRMRGEEKAYTTIWITLGQRTLSYETYVLPAPEENVAAFFEHVLRRNYGLVGAHFAVGPEDAVYLMGSIPVQQLGHGRLSHELDQIIGTLWAYSERVFPAALRIGWGSRFRQPPF
jgi:hypothetical protein